MRDNQILLSICIPTYNRIKSLTELLESIENQKYPLTYEVYIQDNDSSDNTGELAKQFCNRLPNWHYEKNDTNIGGILNIKKCTEKATGRYMIIIGDDDALFPHAFETIDNAIKQTDQNVMKAIFFNKKLGTFYHECKKFENGFEWLRKVSIHAPSFISAVLWEREYWENFDYHENLKQFAIPQLHLFVDACHEKKVWGSTIALVDVGWSFPTTNIKAYFFYKYYALVDCFEYPYLYDSVLRNPDVDSKTRAIIFLRKARFIKEILKKIAFMKNNANDYAEPIARLHKSFSFRPFTNMIRIYMKVIFHTPVGGKLAQKICPDLILKKPINVK